MIDVGGAQYVKRKWEKMGKKLTFLHRNLSYETI